MGRLRTVLEEAYNRIESSSNPESELPEVLVNLDVQELFDLMDEPEEAFDQRSFTLALRSISSFVGFLELENESEDVFYSKLWDYMILHPMFADEEMRLAALLALAIQPSLPYVQLGDFQMDWKEYAAYLSDNSRECEIMDNLMYREFENAGSAAAAMLELVTAPEEHRAQVAMMAYLISLLRSNDDQDSYEHGD